jgi:hypothetical protein
VAIELQKKDEYKGEVDLALGGSDKELMTGKSVKVKVRESSYSDSNLKVLKPHMHYGPTVEGSFGGNTHTGAFVPLPTNSLQSYIRKLNPSCENYHYISKLFKLNVLNNDISTVSSHTIC